MSENSSNRPPRRSRGGRGGNRNRRGPRRSAPRKPKPLTGWQKFLKALTFGAYNPHKKPAKRGKSGVPQTRTPRPQAEVAPKPKREKRPRSERPKRAPEIIEVTTERLYVGNLSYDAAESDLFELFNGVGQVTNAEIVTHRRTMRSKGYAFVSMNTVDEAKRAVEVLHDQEFMGRKLLVSGAKAKPETAEP
ncbi:MAG: RNA-binding protein [Verrucomicrobiota bacterium]